MADAAHPQDGRGCQRLPTRRITFPAIDGLRSRVEFHRRGRFDAAITLHDGRSFGVVRQGLALRRRSLYDRLRAIAQYDYERRPGAVLVLAPSPWELRRTARFCIVNDLRDCYVGVESRDTPEGRDLPLWCEPTGLFGLSYCTLETVTAHGERGGGAGLLPERKRASLPDPERMARAAPAFGVSPAEKRTLDIVTDYPMIPREHLATWLGVSEGRISQPSKPFCLLVAYNPEDFVGRVFSSNPADSHPSVS